MGADKHAATPAAAANDPTPQREQRLAIVHQACAQQAEARATKDQLRTELGSICDSEAASAAALRAATVPPPTNSPMGTRPASLCSPPCGSGHAAKHGDLRAPSAAVEPDQAQLQASALQCSVVSGMEHAAEHTRSWVLYAGAERDQAQLQVASVAALGLMHEVALEEAADADPLEGPPAVPETTPAALGPVSEPAPAASANADALERLLSPDAALVDLSLLGESAEGPPASHDAGVAAAVPTKGHAKPVLAPAAWQGSGGRWHGGGAYCSAESDRLPPCSSALDASPSAGASWLSCRMGSLGAPRDTSGWRSSDPDRSPPCRSAANLSPSPGGLGGTFRPCHDTGGEGGRVLQEAERWEGHLAAGWPQPRPATAPVRRAGTSSGHS